MQLEARGFVLRRNWLLPAVFAGAGVAGLVVALGGEMVIGWFAAWVGLFMAPVLVARNAFPRALPVTLRASAQGLTFAGVAVAEPPLAAEEIQEVKLVAHGREALVTLLDRVGRTVVLRLARRDAQACVDLLGARRATFRLMVPLWKRVYGLLVLLTTLSFLALGNTDEFVFSLAWVVMLALLGAMLLGYLRGRLVVGSDGFTTSWLGLQRFVPYREVTSVVQRSSWNGSQIDAVVTLRSGKKKQYRVLESPDTETERHAEVLALIAHLVAAAQRAAQRVGTRVDVPGLVGRGGRSDRAWLSAIDAMVHGRGHHYRVAALSPELLAEVTTDPTATADSRLGAAAALVRIGDEPARARIRIAAEACADPDLRGALLAMAEAHDDESTEKALRVLRR